MQNWVLSLIYESNPIQDLHNSLECKMAQSLNFLERDDISISVRGNCSLTKNRLRKVKFQRRTAWAAKRVKCRIKFSRPWHTFATRGYIGRTALKPSSKDYKQRALLLRNIINILPLPRPLQLPGKGVDCPENVAQGSMRCLICISIKLFAAKPNVVTLLPWVIARKQSVL